MTTDVDNLWLCRAGNCDGFRATDLCLLKGPDGLPCNRPKGHGGEGCKHRCKARQEYLGKLEQGEPRPLGDLARDRLLREAADNYRAAQETQVALKAMIASFEAQIARCKSDLATAEERGWQAWLALKAASEAR